MECIVTKKKKTIYIIILILSAAVFIACAVYFITDYLNYKSAVDIGGVISQSSSETESSSGPKTVDVPIDFEELKAVNEDIYAWIRIPYSDQEDKYIADYPILQHQTERDYYLEHNANSEKSTYGAIYTQYYNEKDFSDFNTLIYGHNMRNGSMFGSLKKYRSRDFFDKNREIIIYMPNRILKYQIFGAYVFDDRHILMSFDFDTEEGIEEYLDTVSSYNSISSNFDKDIEVTASDKIITLSTCTSNEGQRYLVQAVLVYDSATE